MRKKADMMKKDIAYYMGLPYREIIETDPHGGFVGHIAELPGCITQAETKRDLLDQLDDAKLSWIEAALEDGVPIPEPLQEESASESCSDGKSGGGQSKSVGYRANCRRAQKRYEYILKES